MSSTQHPAAARAGLPATPSPAVVSSPRSAPRPAPEPPSTRSVRRCGLLLAVGAGLWAVVTLTVGLNEPGPVWGRVSEASGSTFQIGVVALLRVMWRTRATGTSRAAVVMLVIEQVLLGLACLATVGTTIFFGSTHPVLVALDACWPISMLGMFVIAVKVAAAGRWTGVLRVLPIWAESYFPLMVVVVALFGRDAIDVGSATLVLSGYGVLGVVLVARPHLTGARC